MFLLKSIGELADRLICIVFAILFAQAPLYIEQYIHVLTGAKAEARIAYEDIEKRAASLIPPLSVDEFISHHLKSEDNVFQESGKHFQEMVTRLKNYEAAFEKLSSCSVWEKPFVFMRYADPALRDALEFKPGFPFSREGLGYALAGAVAGLILVSIIRLLFTGRKPKTPPVIQSEKEKTTL
ncbi:MAG: DUF2937 family protein [Bacteroidia bacterium]|nr:DUF2937 family protein [Bacteroidia bacterium]